MNTKSIRPTFDQLPLRTGDPPFSAWGLYGDNDELGTLNLLTEAVVANAAKEIKTGKRISLDWPLDKIRKPAFDRQPFHNELVPKSDKLANDDVITMNTQGSSQWDGLRHFAYQKARPEKLFYNGRSNEDFYGPGASKVNGVHVMAQNGGICGRGVLIDHLSYARRHGIEKDALSSHAIPLSELLAAAKEQDTAFCPGDILFVRVGFTQKFENSSPAEQDAMSNAPGFSGVEPSLEAARWVWDNQFSAVAGDTPSWESWPTATKHGLALHEIFLAGWGCPIGEMFDLEALAAYCEQQKRWSFFCASVPLYNTGGAASPANTVAIF